MSLMIGMEYYCFNLMTFQDTTYFLGENLSENPELDREVTKDTRINNLVNVTFMSLIRLQLMNIYGILLLNFKETKWENVSL